MGLQQITGNEIAAGSIAATDLASNLAITGDVTISGLTVGKGANAVAENTAVGASALSSGSLSGDYNTAVGRVALQSNTSGAFNSAFGRQALGLNTTGQQNTGIGHTSIYTNTTGSYNSALGMESLYSNTTGSNNVAVGYTALRSNTTASENTAVGYRAGYSGTTAGYNTIIGTNAAYSITTGSYNTVVGREAGYNLTTGTSNYFFGNSAGNAITTGSKNTVIGSYSGNQGGLDIRTLNNRIVISDGDGNPRIYNDGQTTTFYAGTGGDVQIIPDSGGVTGGTTGRIGWTVVGYTGQNIGGDVIASAAYGVLNSDSGTSGWKIRTYSNSYAYRFEFNANGAAYNTTGTWGTISDIRIKQDIVPANSAWSDIKALAFKKYRFKSDVAFESSEENTKGFVAPTMFGLIAQEVQKISPGLVEETDSDEVEDGKLLAIKTSVMLMKATKALQEAMERIETLETKIQQLENK